MPEQQRIGRPLRRAHGFTLVELVIVVAVIGALIAITGRVIANQRDSATARLLTETAVRAANNWNLLASTAGSSSAIGAGNALYANGTNVHGIIFGGRNNVANDYQRYWDSAGLKALNGMGVPNAECTSGYSVSSYCVTVSGGGNASIVVQYDGIPDSMALKLAQMVDGSVASVPSSGMTLGSLTLGAASGGTRSASFSKDF